MSIRNTPKTNDFTLTDNAIIRGTMPDYAQKVLLYLLSMPESWNFIFNHVKKTLAITGYKLRKAMTWLQANGYASYVKLTSGKTIWNIYDTPQKHIINQPRVDFPHVENEHDYQYCNTINTEINNNTVLITELPEPQIPVVVFSEPITKPTEIVGEPITEIVLPESLPEPCRPMARKSLNGLDTGTITALLMVFGTAIANGTVKNPMGYFMGLVKSAKNGTFTEPSETPTIEPLEIRLRKQQEQEQQRAKSSQISNEQYYRALYKRFGNAVIDSIPIQYRNA